MKKTFFYLSYCKLFLELQYEIDKGSFTYIFFQNISASLISQDQRRTKRRGHFLLELILVCSAQSRGKGSRGKMLLMRDNFNQDACQMPGGERF